MMNRTTLDLADLTETDIAAARQRLDDSRDALVREVRPLSDAQRRYRSTPPAWSIADVVEHLALLEELFHERIAASLEAGPPSPSQSDARRIDALVVAVEPDPAAKFVVPGRVSLGDAPGPILPTGRWTTEDSLDRFLARRRETVIFLEVRGSELRGHAVDHPALGPLDGFQWVLFIACHTDRHLAQIRALRADSAFPSR
jgi:hypothetical protein